MVDRQRLVSGVLLCAIGRNITPPKAIQNLQDDRRHHRAISHASSRFGAILHSNSSERKPMEWGNSDRDDHLFVGHSVSHRTIDVTDVTYYG